MESNEEESGEECSREDDEEDEDEQKENANWVQDVIGATPEEFLQQENPQSTSLVSVMFRCPKCNIRSKSYQNLHPKNRFGRNVKPKFVCVRCKQASKMPDRDGRNSFEDSEYVFYK